MRNPAQAQELLALLKRRGPLPTKDILETLKISQSTFSRLTSTLSSVIAIGEGRSRLYAATRSDETFPLSKVSESASIQALGEIKLIAPKGAVFVPQKSSGLRALIFEDIPYFIWDMRPQGYLGKIFIQEHADLQLPQRWEDWQESDLYRTLKLKGYDLVGNLLIGLDTFKQFQTLDLAPVARAKRKTEYPKLAQRSLEGFHTGSSAGGEQPKFATSLQNGQLHNHVIVKFSPPLNTKAGRRWGDLLYAEEQASKVLKRAGYEVSQIEALEANDQVFLEVTRFDRIGKKGRRGILSLGAFDDEYVGARLNWTETALKLGQKKLLNSSDVQKMIFLDCFGANIANTDRHFGNLSVFWELGANKSELAPVYDMLPMLYAPIQGNLVERKFKKPSATFKQIHIWKNAVDLASEYWNTIAQDERISSDFRKIAQKNATIITEI